MPKKLSSDSLGFLITDSARLMRMMFERRITDAGLNLTPGEARTLLHVAMENGSRQLDLAARMGVEPMTVCTFLDKLQASGLIERQQDPSDRRAKKIVLTERSDSMIDSINMELQSLLADATRGITEETKLLMQEALGTFRINLQKMTR